MAVRRGAPSLLESFNYAFEGIIHVLRTQRNMRIHFLIAAGVLLAALFTGVERLVLIAIVNAIAVGYLVFSDQVGDRGSRLLDRISNSPPHVTLITLFLTAILVITLKAFTSRGTQLRGGWPSGHAALAFASWML